ncbi:hypothetical protein BDF19DRAFT_215124 [Syncephalis fuscata]|nr:hypothetical protein BDF19DRAFT_215124 [Syncephalis fuscata]
MLSRLEWRYEKLWLLVELYDGLKKEQHCNTWQCITQLTAKHPPSWLCILFSTSSTESAQLINTIFKSTISCSDQINYSELFDQSPAETTHERFLLMSRCFNVLSARIALHTIGLEDLLWIGSNSVTTILWHRLAQHIPHRSILYIIVILPSTGTVSCMASSPLALAYIGQQ